MSRLRLKSTLITGVLTIIPLWVTWLVFRFLLGLLADLGAPLLHALIHLVELIAPRTARWLDSEWLLFSLATLMTLVALYCIGLFARLVIGQRMLQYLEALLQRIPLVHSIYGGTKKLMGMLQTKPENVQRVVLVDFPRRGIKAVGLVTRVMTETPSGREIAAVYIPTTPNPTGGYLELVPVEELVATDWTIDQAMAFILSGGAVARDTLPGATAATEPITPTRQP